MTTVIDTYSAKTHLSRLLDQVEQGEEVIITRRGKPVAKLVPVQPSRRPVVLGVLKGRISRADLDYDKHSDPEWQAMIDEMESNPIL